MSAAFWLALASLLVVPASADSFDLPHQFVLALGASVLAWRAAAHSVSRRHLVVAVTWLAAALVATLFSELRAASVPALFTLSTAIALSLFVSSTQRWTALLITAWPIAAYALAQALGHDFIDWANVATWCGGTRPFSTLGHPTQLAVWMAMVAVLALEEGQRGTPRLFAWLTAAVCALTCVATLSRAGWLALGVGVLAWAALRFKGNTRRLLPLGGAALVIAALATAVAGPSAILERITHALVAPTRVQLWGTALAGFRHRPWIGWGFDSFLLVDQQFRHPDAWKFEWGGTAAHAHSFPAQVLATQGIAGAVVVVLLIVFVMRTWRRAPSPLLAVVLALAAASMVAFSGVLVLALGWCVLAASMRDVERRMPAWVWFLTLVPLLGTAMLFGASLTGGAAERAAMRADAASSRSRDAAASSRSLTPSPLPEGEGDARARDTARAEFLFRAAASLDVWTGEWPVRHGVWLEQQQKWLAARARYELAVQRAPGVAVFEANVGRMAGRVLDRDGTHQWFERARRHAPLDAHIALDAADAALRLEEFELANDALRTVLGLYPTDGPAWLMLARLRLAQQRPVEARAALEAALDADWRDWPEGAAITRTLLAAIQEGLGDPFLAAETRARKDFVLPSDICGAPSKLGLK
ncbi:MAG: O-antigen ligase family protein [Archangium sp.]|nr:O-antigen ligase family protein [Archangium sp.]